MSRPLRHAIVGCGRVAVNHADAFRQLAGVELACACDVRPAAAAELAAAWGIADTCDDPRRLLADPAIDSLSLAVPHDLHEPLAVAAIAAGKHVLIEKPLAVDRAAAERIVTAAAAADGVVVAPVAQHRFDPLVRGVGELVAAGALGRIAQVRGRLECYRPPEYYRDSDWRGTWSREGGSVLINQGYHLIDLVVWLAGPVTRLSAEMDTLGDPTAMETEDTLTATLRFASGALGSLAFTGAGGEGWSNELELLGTAGVVAFDLAYPNRLLRLDLADGEAAADWRRRLEAATAERPVPPPGAHYYGISHRAQARDFVDRIRRGESGGPGLAEAAATVAVIDAAYASARRRRPVAPGDGGSGGA